MTPWGCSDFPSLFLFMLQKERRDTRKKTKYKLLACLTWEGVCLNPRRSHLSHYHPSETHRSSFLVPAFKESVVMSQPQCALSHWVAQRGAPSVTTFAAQALPALLFAQDRTDSYFQSQSPWPLNSFSWESQPCWNSIELVLHKGVCEAPRPPWKTQHCMPLLTSHSFFSHIAQGSPVASGAFLSRHLQIHSLISFSVALASQMIFAGQTSYCLHAVLWPSAEVVRRRESNEGNGEPAGVAPARKPSAPCCSL